MIDRLSTQKKHRKQAAIASYQSFNRVPRHSETGRSFKTSFPVGQWPMAD